MVITRVKQDKQKFRVKTVQVFDIPKIVLVRVYRENMVLEAFARYDGRMVHCKKLGLTFVPDPSVKPIITYFKGKPYVTFNITDNGKPLIYKIDKDTLKFDKKDVDAQFVESIVSSKIFAQLFSKLRGIDISSLMFGIGIGLFIIVFLLFFILPIIGIPVSIGQKPIEINIPNYPSAPTSGGFP